MKKQLSGKVKYFKAIMLRSMALCGLLTLLQASKSMAQMVYARVEYANITYESMAGEADNTAYAYIRFYSDVNCTMPTTLPQNTTIYFTYTFTGTGGPSTTTDYVQGNQGDSEEVIADGNIIDEWDYSDDYNTQLVSVEHYRFDTVDDPNNTYYFSLGSVGI